MKAVLDHVGIAVSDLPASLAFFKDVLGLHVEASEEIASQRVRATFVNTGQSTLEMLEATTPDSPIAALPVGLVDRSQLRPPAPCTRRI